MASPSSAHPLNGKTILLITPSLAALGFLRSLLLALDKIGVDVHLASSSRGFAKVEVPHQVTYHEIDMQRGANILGHIKAAKALNKIVNCIQPDLIDTHYSAAMVTSALARRKNWPISIATVQGLRFPHSKGIAKLTDTLAELGSGLRMEQVSVLTECDLIAAQKYRVNNFRLQQSLGFGCDLTRFDPTLFSSKDKTSLRKTLGISGNVTLCIYVGRYVKFKGFDVALRAFNEASKQDPNLHLLLCGTADTLHPSGVSSDELEDLKTHPKISDLGWTSSIEKYLSISDICLFPSEREGVPVSLMEALSMGVPVITADSRGCRDVVTDGTDGYVLQGRNHRKYAEKIIELSHNTQHLNKLSEAALGNRAKFDSRNFVSESIGEYQRFITND